MVLWVCTGTVPRTVPRYALPQVTTQLNVGLGAEAEASKGSRGSTAPPENPARIVTDKTQRSDNTKTPCNR
jgi:hypothetical protein